MCEISKNSYKKTVFCKNSHNVAILVVAEGENIYHSLSDSLFIFI